jgi:serine/threonine protein kinase
LLEHHHLSTNSFNQGYYERFFVQQAQLGRGFRGSVYTCQHVLDNVSLATYAVKKVPVGDNHPWLVKMLKEVKLLEKLKHENIIEYKHSWLENHQATTFGPSIPCLFILMERANGGNLEEYLLSTKLSTAQIWSLFMDIVNGLNYLHKHGIIHRDLKPSNLLLQFSESEGLPRLLISDFGECEILNELAPRLRTGATGTLEYMAPELLMQSEGKYLDTFDPKADLWSLGVILYLMVYGKTPWRDLDDVDVLKTDILETDVVFEPCDDRLLALMKMLMHRDASKRPSCQDILDMQVVESVPRSWKPFDYAGALCMFIVVLQVLMKLFQ